MVHPYRGPSLTLTSCHQDAGTSTPQKQPWPSSDCLMTPSRWPQGGRKGRKRGKDSRHSMAIHSFRRSLGISGMFCLSPPPPPLLLLLRVQGELTCSSDSLHPPDALPALLMYFGAEFIKWKILLEVRVDGLIWGSAGDVSMWSLGIHSAKVAPRCGGQLTLNVLPHLLPSTLESALLSNMPNIGLLRDVLVKSFSGSVPAGLTGWYGPELA